MGIDANDIFIHLMKGRPNIANKCMLKFIVLEGKNRKRLPGRYTQVKYLFLRSVVGILG